MAQMFIDPREIRAYSRTHGSDGLESFDPADEVDWFVIHRDTGARLAGPYATVQEARAALARLIEADAPPPACS